MTTTKSHDLLNRLTAVSSAPSGAGVPPVSFAYQNNSANQRTRNTLADGSYWVYEYDVLGQVKSGKRYWQDGTPVAGQQFEYAFDDIGNRKSTKAGGDASGANLRAAAYEANASNQYTNRTVPGTNDVMGAALLTNSVTVNGMTAYRRGEYFWKEAGTNNTGGPAWLGIAVSSAGSNVTGHVFVPQTPESFGYDADGNLDYDGRWDYTWDGENRLTSIERIATAPDASKVRLDCQYDERSRRTQKVVFTNDGSGYVAVRTNNFLYDGWNLVAMLDHTNGLDRTFIWGTDLSGTMQGAGGVGGLISMTVHQGTNAGTYFYCFDGNGNVAALVNTADGAVAGRWEYDPFLGIIRATGPLAYLNPFLGSTKFYDWETGLYYYGYRYYDPETGRWPNRDPIGEEGGINLYGFVANNPVARLDQLGMKFGNPVCDHNGSVVCPSTWRSYPCCVESLDIVTSGKFQGGLTANDYLPQQNKQLQATYNSDNPDDAGKFVNETFVGVKVQFVSSTLFPSSACSFSQEVTVVEEVSGGVRTGREGSYDDIEKSGWDQSKPPFRQSVNCSPSMADVVTMNNTPQSKSHRMFTTCLKSGGDGVAFCKNRECCVRWSVEMEVDANGKVQTPRVDVLRRWCQ